MIDRDKAAAIATCFIRMYRAEKRGRTHEAEVWKEGILALLEGEEKAA